jgi:PilZ domain-containing protein
VVGVRADAQARKKLKISLKGEASPADSGAMESVIRPGQDIVLSSSDGAVECHVVAAAGYYVLLRPVKPRDLEFASTFAGRRSSLTYLDGKVPAGVDGAVEAGTKPNELRFRVEEEVDRRSSVRVPVYGKVVARIAGVEPVHGELLDISAGGLRFRHQTKLRIASGTPVRIRTELPNGPVVDADGHVRTAMAGVISVQFSRMHDTSTAELGAWSVNLLRSHLSAG